MTLKILYSATDSSPKNKTITSNRAVGRPGWNSCTSLIKQDVSSLLAYVVFRYGMNVAVIKAVPLPIDGVFTVSYETAHNHD